MLDVKKIKMLLGSPVIKIELTDEQIDTNIELTSKQTDCLIKIFKCESLRDFIFDKLVIANCKKNWANVINKYKGILPDGMEITDHYYRSAMDEEANLLQYLYTFKNK